MTVPDFHGVVFVYEENTWPFIFIVTTLSTCHTSMGTQRLPIMPAASKGGEVNVPVKLPCSSPWSGVPSLSRSRMPPRSP